MCNNGLLSDKENANAYISKFKQEIKIPFIRDLFEELDSVMKCSNDMFATFDVFNMDKRKCKHQLCLKKKTLTNQLLKTTVTISSAKDFFSEFNKSISHNPKKVNKMIKGLYQKGKCKKPNNMEINKE